MRARLHVKDGRFGFFREGTHELCDAGPTRQLLPATIDALQTLQPVVAAGRARHRASFPKTPRQPSGRCFSNWSRPKPSRFTSTRSRGFPDCCSPIIKRGIRRSRTGRRTSPSTSRRQPVRLPLTHHVQSFFQGNRYLLAGARQPRARARAGGNGHGPVRRRRPVCRSARGAGAEADCRRRRGPLERARSRGECRRRTARRFTCAICRLRAICSGGACSGLTRSCSILREPACPGRRCRAFSASRFLASCISHATRPRWRATSNDSSEVGYRLDHIEAFDLFPNTAHVETLAVLTR